MYFAYNFYSIGVTMLTYPQIILDVMAIRGSLHATLLFIVNLAHCDYIAKIVDHIDVLCTQKTPLIIFPLWWSDTSKFGDAESSEFSA